MPIYQYQCTDCGEEFEYVIVQSNDQASCPKCSSIELKKQMSLFSVGQSKAASKAVDRKEISLTDKPTKSQNREHVGCSGSYAKSLLKKYG